MSEKAKRVCMIAYTFYEKDGRVRLEAESLVNWGHEVFFLTPKAGKKARNYELCGVNIVELNVLKYRGKSKLGYLASHLRFMVLAFFACTSLFIKSRIHVIHVHNMPDVLVFSAIIPRLFGCKLVLDVHDSVPETYAAKFESGSRFLFRLLSFEEWLCCAFVHRVICVNHVQRDALIERRIPAKKIATVITMPTFAGKSEPRNLDPEKFRVVNHGTISKRLGIDLLVLAADKLAKQIPGFELHIIGAGDDWDEVARLTETMNLGATVKLHGAVAWDALPKALSMMDAGIVANRVNIATQLMLPSKLIDYVRLGIPAIVPRLKTIEYYFSPEMVVYFEPGDVDSIVAAITELYRSPERRRQQPVEAKKFIEIYNWSKNTELRDMYADLFETRRSTETGLSPSPKELGRASDVASR